MGTVNPTLQARVAVVASVSPGTMGMAGPEAQGLAEITEDEF